MDELERRLIIMKKLNYLLLIVIVVITGCYREITYKIVDADTKQPIKGAVVNVVWSKTHGLPGLTYHKIYKQVEAISDENGNLYIEGCYDLFVDFPRTTIYKNGYIVWNDEYIFPNWEKRKDFKWKSRTINLEKFNTKYPILNPEYSNVLYGSNRFVNILYEWDGSSSFNPKYTHYRHMDFVSSCLIVWSGNKMKSELEIEERKAEKDRYALIKFMVSAKIVDKESHEGLSGAVIKLSGKGWGYDYSSDSVSDENGTVLITGDAPLLANPPSIVIEKKGYDIWHLRNRRLEEFDIWGKIKNGYAFELIKCNDKYPGDCFK